jgi:hypothetical protein
MNLNTNGAKAIAALVALNAGIFLSHHVPMHERRGPAVQAELIATRAEICKARTEARMAAYQARMQTRAAAREALKARKQIQQETAHAAAMAPTSAVARTHSTITSYVHCILASGVRSVNGGI